MKFSDIHGLEDTKKRLISSAQQNHVAHAQLFTGVEGSALLPMALAFASYLNCENPSDTDSCGECGACSKSHKYVHPDIHFVYPVSGTEDVKVKDAISKAFLPYWRNFLLDNPFGNLTDWALAFGGENKQLSIYRRESREIIDALSLKAFEGKFKIMIIWMPERMHMATANGILKILEEPASNTVFLLVSPNHEQLLRTIRSRTQLIRIPPFNSTELVHILTHEHGLEKPKATQLTHLADGSLRTALKIHEEADINLHTMFINWMRNCFAYNFEELSTDAEKFAALPKSAQRTLLLYGLEILRESLVANQEEDKLLRMTGDEMAFVKKFSKTLTTTLIDKLAINLNDSHYHLERNANAKIVFMNLSIIFSNSFKR
jgi:DNA polymerase III subunit delta'